MSLSDIVNVSITAQTTTVTQAGFGTPLIAAYHTVTPDRVREYGSLTEMTDAGFATTDPAYLIASKIKSQNPSVTAWKVGRRASAFTQAVTLTPINTTEDYVYEFDVVVGTTTTSISYTVPGSATVNSIATALQPLLDAISGVTAVDNTGSVTVTTDTAGVLVDYVGASADPDSLDFKDDTTDPGLAADLTAIETEDPDWYGLCLDSNSEAEILAAAAWIESRSKILGTNSSDTEIVDGAVTDDVMSDMQDLSYARTLCLYSGARLLNWSGAGWLGNRLPSTPGSSNWAFKTLVGVTVDSLTAGQTSAIEAKSGNTYRTIGGVNVTTYGVTPGGEFIDVTRVIDWIEARVQERVFAALANAEKIPYTDAGVDVIRSIILGVLNQGVANGALAADPAPYVTAPLVADVAAVDKAARQLPDVTFQAVLAGAINNIVVSGVLSV